MTVLVIPVSIFNEENKSSNSKFLIDSFLINCSWDPEGSKEPDLNSKSLEPFLYLKVPPLIIVSGVLKFLSI